MEKTSIKKAASGFVQYWHEIAAATYITICIFDFLLMPFWYQIQNDRLTPDVVVSLTMKYPATEQVMALQVLDQHKSWTPITTQDGGTFHIAFGAILAAGAWRKRQQFGLGNPTPYPMPLMPHEPMQPMQPMQPSSIPLPPGTRE